MGQFCKPSRAEPSQKDESEKTRVAPKGATLVFPFSSVFMVPDWTLFRFLTVWPSFVRGGENKAMPVLIPDTV